VNTALTGTGAGGAGGGGGKGGGGFTPAIQDATTVVENFTAALRGGSSGANATASAPPGTNVTVTVNVDGTTDPTQIADQVWDVLVPSLQDAFQRNNRTVLKHVNGAA